MSSMGGRNVARASFPVIPGLETAREAEHGLEGRARVLGFGVPIPSLLRN